MTKREEELKKLIGKTIVSAEGDDLYDASFKLILDNGYVVNVTAYGDDMTRIYVNGT